MDAPTSPTTSTSAPSSPASSSAGGPGAGLAGGASSSADSASAGGATPEHTPPRRRLVKAASRHFDDQQPPRVSAKRESGGIGTGPPGFAFERSGSPSPVSTGIGGGPASSSLGASSASPSISGSFRDRERTGIRSSLKGDLQGEYSMNSPHGPAGSSGPSKVGRTPFAANPGVTDARPLGRRPEVNLRRQHEAPNAQKHAEDMRIQQAKRAALVRAQTMGAPGNYRSFDSQFGNYLVPVIPNQFFNKNPPTSQASPALPSQVNQSR
ncbi:hypothetical protein MPTK1_3g16480 [Marchantia polymorpha subsp. ruderalis]|uniref:Uncharacterized protein n=2 Tax=Marchantia polymorpha TaxID=3197 RepID=A0A176VMT5_MARPO|nr:hypothetical protein AXG93_3271s1230 [Marchantia polymorpha subsp. ruderalis]PTQ48724.1 hypothetical protein MARPO_0004s0023 [Marchantia polymorpha]BBN05853.1 hypothetical protein Mp_3g16480 [Marchantia polymorpha subsp. ruderalis]|eukprot:PTQ48724.1 hypothetical protein MARPO_0004s0023 [Marchantia polymorpha]